MNPQSSAAVASGIPVPPDFSLAGNTLSDHADGNEPIRVLIVGRETSARERFLSFFEGKPEFNVVAQCGTGGGIVKALDDFALDLIVLDMAAPGAEDIRPEEMTDLDWPPAVVAVAETEEWAFRAFEINAVDYVLKSCDRPRFERALRRAKTTIRARRDQRLNKQILTFLEEMKSPPQQYLNHFVIKSEQGGFLLHIEDVDWIEAERNYIVLHAGKSSHIIRENISAVESRLDPQRFVRIHRSTIVNLSRIVKLYPLFHGDFKVVLRDGAELSMSRGYRKNLEGAGK